MSTPTTPPYTDNEPGNRRGRRERIITQVIAEDRNEDTPSPRTELLSESSSPRPRVSHPSHALETRRKKKGRSRKDGATDLSHSQSSSTQQELVRLLIDQEHEASKLRKTLSAAVQRLESESQRAADLDRENRETAERFRILNDTRLTAQQEASKASQELRLYQFQLENAQREISRAQETLRKFERERDEAEAVAARARTKARRLQREKLVSAAREEGRRTGFQAGIQHAQEISISPTRGGRQRRGPPTIPSDNPDQSYATGDDAVYQRQPEPQEQEREELEGEDDDLDDLDDLGIDIEEATPNDSLASPIPRYPTRNLDPGSASPPHSTRAPGARSYTPSIQVYSLPIPPTEQLAREYNTNSNPNDVVLNEPRGSWVTARKHGEINGVQATPPQQSGSGVPTAPPLIIPQQQQSVIGERSPLMLGQQQPFMQQPSPVTGQQPPLMNGQPPPVMGQQQQQPMNGQPPPVMGQQLPLMNGQPPPTMMQQQQPINGQPPPNMGQQQQPVTGQPPPIVGQQPPPIMGQQPIPGQPPIIIGQQHPGFGQHPLPNMGQMPPPMFYYPQQYGPPPPQQQRPGHRKGVSFPSLFKRPSGTKPKTQANSWYRSFSFRKKNKPVIDPEPVVDPEDDLDPEDDFVEQEQQHTQPQQQQSRPQQRQSRDPQQSRRSGDLSSSESAAKMYNFQPAPPQSWYVGSKKSQASIRPTAGAGPSSAANMPNPPPKMRSQAFDTFSFPRSRAASMDDAASMSTSLSQLDLVTAPNGSASTDATSVRSGKYGGKSRARERDNRMKERDSRAKERDRDSFLSVIKEDPMSRGNTPVADRLLGKQTRDRSNSDLPVPPPKFEIPRGGFSADSSTSSRRRGPPPEIYVPPHPGARDDPFHSHWPNLSQATFGPIPPGGKQLSSNTGPQPWPAHPSLRSDTDDYEPLMTRTPGISVLPPSATPSEPHPSLSTTPHTGKNHLTPNYVYQPPQVPSPRRPLASDPTLRYNEFMGSTESFYTDRTHPRTPVNAFHSISPRAGGGISSPRGGTHSPRTGTNSRAGTHSPRALGTNSPRGGGRRSAQSVTRPPMSVTNPSPPSPSPPPLPYQYKSNNPSQAEKSSPPPIPVPYQSPLPVPYQSPLTFPDKSPSNNSINPLRPSSAQSGASNSRVRSASAHVPMGPPPGEQHKRPASIRSFVSSFGRASPNGNALRSLAEGNQSQSRIRRVPSTGSIRSMHSYNHFEPQSYLDPAYFQGGRATPNHDDAEEMHRRRRQERDARSAAGSVAGSVYSRAGSTSSFR